MLFSGSLNSTAKRGLGRGTQPSVTPQEAVFCFTDESRKNRKTRSVLMSPPAPLPEEAVQETSIPIPLPGFL